MLTKNKFKVICTIIICTIIISIFCINSFAANFDGVGWDETQGNYYPYVKVFYRYNIDPLTRDDSKWLAAIVGGQGPTENDMNHNINAASGYYIELYNYSTQQVQDQILPFGSIIVGINIYNTVKLLPDYTSGTKYSYLFISHICNTDFMEGVYNEVINEYGYDEFLTYEGFQDFERQLQRCSSNESDTKPDYLIFSSEMARFLNRYTEAVIDEYNRITSQIIGDVNARFNTFVGGTDNLSAIINFPDRYSQLMYRFRSNFNRDTYQYQQNASYSYFTGYTDSRAQNIYEWWSGVFETGIYDWMPDGFYTIITSIMAVVLVVITVLVGKKILL